MEEKETNNVIRIRILELEDKLMDIIEISNKYPDVPVPVFELEMKVILKEIEYLEGLDKTYLT